MTKYMKVYQAICLKAILNKRSKTDTVYYEKHHYQPKSLGGTEISQNLVLLTAKEHFICHFLLYKHFKSVKNIISRDKMLAAWNMMCCIAPDQKRFTSSSFKIAREKWAEVMHKRVVAQETKNKISKTLTGRKLPQEVIDKIIIANTGRKHSIKTKMKMSEWQTGRKLSQEHCENISVGKTGKIFDILECPICNKKGAGPNMERYHFDNCGNDNKQQVIKCPHCDKSGGKSSMKRYHFDNCKLKEN